MPEAGETAKYPGALVTLADLGGPVDNFARLTLDGAINNSTTSIIVHETIPTTWPQALWLTIESEIVRVTSWAAKTFTTAARDGSNGNSQGTTPASHIDSVRVGRYLTEQAWNQLEAEVIAIEIALGLTPGGELGGTWASPTVDATHSGSAHHTRLHSIIGASDHDSFPGGTSTFLRADGTFAAPAVSPGITIVAEQATTSGTSIDFTGIPAGTKRITVMLIGVSTNGSSLPVLRIGDSGGIETTGYTAAVATLDNGSANFVQGATGEFPLVGLSWAASDAMYGSITLTLEDSSDFTWVSVGSVRVTASRIHTHTGSKATSAVLDRVRLTTVNGTDAFDAGVASISYES